jgi:SAM-dependent methyltransferase
MQVTHKPWDWSKNNQESWLIPADESWYLLNRWKQRGFRDFLDLGAGLGRHSLQFAEQGFLVHALDLSESAMNGLSAMAREKNLPITTATGDMDKLPYISDKFDCAIAYHVISHTDTLGIQKTIAELARVLRDGGEYFLTLCSKKTWSYERAGFPRVDDNTVIKIEDGPENGIPHFFADDEEIVKLLKRENLISVKHTQETIIDGKDYGSWHYFILGRKTGDGI